MDIITTTTDLRSLCRALASETFIAVDTEFIREQTYWPQLCLVQIAGSGREAIIDPLASGLDLSPFFELMGDERVIKVFHSARQDVELIHNLAGLIPRPLFDTQVAAMVCGFGEQASYEQLARKLAKVEIDKSSRFTDWSRRPLSHKQLAYAMSDVTHLRKVYGRLRDHLDRSGREDWLEEEMGVLTSPSTYAADPANAWQRVKFRPRKARQLAVLIEVAAWREREAQARDVPRGRILKDDAVAEIALHAPLDVEALKALRGVPRGFAGSRLAEGLLQAVAAGLARDPASLPALPRAQQPFPETPGPVVDVLKLALKIVCEREGVAAKLVASSADIEAIALGRGDDVPALSGWRREVYGETALRLMDGRLGIALTDGRAEIAEVEPVARLKAAE
jgi:ribonuclease D